MRRLFLVDAVVERVFRHGCCNWLILGISCGFATI